MQTIRKLEVWYRVFHLYIKINRVQAVVKLYGVW